MDVNSVGQGNSLNIPCNIDSISSNNDKVIKEVRQIQSKNEKYNKEELDKSLEKLNSLLKNEQTHAEYSVHKDFGTIMIKIVNDNTKDVVMEIPPHKILDMIASMCKQCGIFDKKA